MGQALQQITQQTQQLNHWTDLWFDEHKRAGYVAVTNDFKKHYFYGSNDVDRIIKATAGRKDQYISLNAFDVNWKEKEFSIAISKAVATFNYDYDSRNNQGKCI